jgi:quercetin dioxygenase-like cupin family protein
MKTKTKVIIGAAIATALAGLALATPIFNLASPVLATGNDNTWIDEHGAATAANGESFTASLTTQGPSTILIQDAAYSPGGHNGWHSHPGLVMVTLIAGSIQWFDANCKPTFYTAGDSWVEGGQVHYFRVVSTVNVHLMASFVIAQGEPPRTDQPAPACAAALGLD